MMSKNEREMFEKIQNERNAAQLSLSEAKRVHTEEVEKLKKELDQQKGYVSMYQNTCAKTENELEAAHSLLDGLPQASPRETEGENSYQRKTIPLTTRLATWIAKVAFSEAFKQIGIK